MYERFNYTKYAIEKERFFFYLFDYKPKHKEYFNKHLEDFLKEYPKIYELFKEIKK